MRINYNGLKLYLYSYSFKAVNPMGNNMSFLFSKREKEFLKLVFLGRKNENL